MSTFILCLIIIQVSIFLIGGIMLGITFFTDYGDPVENGRSALIQVPVRAPVVLTRSEREYFAADFAERL